jgi:hypothetical protein
MHQSVVCLHRRKEFGNNPDISKALRLLVSEKNVKRAGKGGRIDPFTYKVGPALPLCHVAFSQPVSQLLCEVLHQCNHQIVLSAFTVNLTPS